MTWLSGWSKRIQLDIDSFYVDEDLTDFPVLITLSSGVGRNDADVTGVFNELSSVSGTKKIMITTTDSTPCYTEIESWDWTNERAWLWTKVPTITSGTDTTLYLYYDKTQPDNDHYVGDTGSESAARVWKSSFDLIYHKAQDPEGGGYCILDSTTNSNNGTPTGFTTSDLVDTMVGPGLDINAQGHNIETSITVTYTGEFSYSTLLQIRSYGNEDALFGSNDYDTGRVSFRSSGGTISFTVYSNNNTDISLSSTIPTETWGVLVIERDSSDNVKVYWNNTEIGSGTRSGSIDLVKLFEGPDNSGWEDMHDAVVSETRFCASISSAASRKVDYYSYFDNLVTFGSEEIEPKYYFDGFVYEKNTPISRVVRVYDRSTGSLMGTDTSRSSDGYYYVTSTSSGIHFLVAFDDDAGDEYNALILDKVAPKGTVY